MEFAVLALFVFAVSIVLPIFLLFRFRKMSDQIAVLERSVRSLTDDALAEVHAPEEEEEVEERQPWQPPEEKIATKEVVETPPPRVFVFKPELTQNVTQWLQKNWFYAVAAVSLALAGVFLVQYGVEKGLLSPTLRVIGAILLGAMFIGAGEYIRRKLGRDEEGTFALLPSAFSSAGIVSIFAGILAARMLYDLIGFETAFAGLALTGLLAIILGWYYGPLLAIVGVFGAIAAPFLVGGESEAGQFLHFYFAGIAAVALAIDSVKRWAWLSSLGLIGAYGASHLLFVEIGHEQFHVMFALITALLAISIPVQKLVPDHSGQRMSSIKLRGKRKLLSDSEFPTRLAFGAFVASSVFVGFVYLVEPTAFWLSLAALSFLTIAGVFWMVQAPALRDFAFIPVIVGLDIIAFEGVQEGAVLDKWLANAARPELDFAAPTLAILVFGALLGSLSFAWRSYQNGDLKRVDAGFAALLAPIVAVIAEVVWSPTEVLGSGNWALYIAVIAIVMTILSERFSRKDGEDRLRTAMFALSAISMLSFVLVVLLSDAALTLALAVMVVAAAWLGGRFKLPLFDRYVQVATIIVSWRLVLEPGMDWALYAPYLEFLSAFAGSIALLIVAMIVKRKNAIKGVAIVLESAIWSLSAVMVSMALIRYFMTQEVRSEFVETGLVGTVWLISSANQLYRLKSGAEMRRARIVLSIIFGIIGTLFVGVSAIALNPLTETSSIITGPYIVDGLAVAYLLPALVLAVVALRFTHLDVRLRRAIGAVGAALAAMYVGLEIRRIWQGDSISGHGVLDGELYSYTVAMMLVAIVLLVLAFVRQSPALRRLALIGVGLTVAKVYLIDMSELDGLLRVVSFLVLGLVLAAMAWVNRILQRNEARGE